MSSTFIHKYRIMRLLILTQYFPPEVGAPQNRLYELALRLQKQDIEVSVLTAMPNYPAMQIQAAYKGAWLRHEMMNGLPVTRAWIFVSANKSLIIRLLNYFSFVFTAFWVGLFSSKKYDYILCESPPLFLGITAWLLSRLRGARLIFNVSDLWPESAEKLGLVTNRFFLGAATILEEFLYKSATIVTGQTQGIVKNISQRFPQKKVYWLKNGVDVAYFKHSEAAAFRTDWRSANGFDADDLLLLYAGILGYAQGLEVILNAAAQLQNTPHIHFLMVGSGPERERLLALKIELNLTNVHFLGLMPKDKMPELVGAVDATVIPLRKLDLFLGAIPSKIFENLAMKKPLVLGVDGEARELFITQGQAGLFFEPENATDLAAQIRRLDSDRDLLHQLGENGLTFVTENFSRDIIAADFAAVLKAL
jgi:glycosyltransferase involved in cell wall biosynthesis